MKIGILDTDQFDGEIKSKYKSYAEMFKRLFLSVDDDIKFNVYEVIKGKFPESLNECDAYLITGSKFSVYDKETWITDLNQFVITAFKQNKTLIGICFGHQMIANSLGGHVEKSDKGWGVGNTLTQIKKHKRWMNDKRQSFNLLVSHQDQVINLPIGAELIATNDFCINSSYQINDTVLCFQGHPEYTVDYIMNLLINRRRSIGGNKADIAEASLTNKHDGALIAKWIIDFIQLQIKEGSSHFP